MGTRRDQRDATRSRILNAALAAFNNHGYQGASTRAITAAAQVSPGLLFHYFPTKGDLYLELVRFGCREVRINGGKGLQSPLEYITATAEHVLSILRDHRDSAAVFVFMNYAHMHPGLVEEADALLREHDIVRKSVPIFEAGQRRGEIRAGSAEALAVAFWGALQGIAEERAANPDRSLPDPDWIVDIVRNRSGS